MKILLTTIGRITCFNAEEKKKKDRIQTPNMALVENSPKGYC